MLEFAKCVGSLCGLAVGYAPTASKVNLDFENGLDEFTQGQANARLLREVNKATGLSTSTFI